MYVQQQEMGMLHFQYYNLQIYSRSNAKREAN